MGSHFGSFMMLCDLPEFDFNFFLCLDHCVANVRTVGTGPVTGTY